MSEYTPAFAALLPVVERLTKRTWRPSLFGDWLSPPGEIRTPADDVEGLLHELCHWIVAAPVLRDADNFGLEDGSAVLSKRWREQENEEKMCGWIEDHLYRLAGVQRSYSSVDDANYRAATRLLPRALAALAASVPAEVQAEIVAALKLPGGDACAYSDP